MRERLTVFIATPAGRGTRHGNRITALRWAMRLRELGHRVRVGDAWRGERRDVLVALHAKKSHASIARHAAEAPSAPRIVALTGTDLYGDIHSDASARESLELATRLVVLQPRGLRELAPHLQEKARTIRQSARGPREPARRDEPGTLLVYVVGHLRDVKAPWLAPEAVALLPATSRVRVVHVGRALDVGAAEIARAWSARSAGRWQWIGELPRREVLRRMASADVTLLTSVSEGGANVVTEAIACGVPVLSTRIDGSAGILGDDYPGMFEVGDAAGLAAALRHCEEDAAFLRELRARCRALSPIVEPAAEREAWRKLLGELG